MPPPTPWQAGTGSPQLLVVDDCVHSLRALASSLRSAHPNCRVAAIDSPLRAVALLEREPVDVVITEVVFDEMRGSRFVEWLASRDPDLPCLIVTHRPDQAPRRTAAPNIQRVLLKPADSEVMAACVGRALRARRLMSTEVAAAPESKPIVSAVACSAPLFAVHRALRSAG